MFTARSIEHLIGVKFNKLTILADLGKVKEVRMCRVKCECGKMKDIQLHAVKSSKTKSCGCIRLEITPKIKNIDHLMGAKFNMLTITEDIGMIDGKRFCMAICECGILRKHEIQSLKTGGTKSCGCLRTKSNLTGNNRRTHGLHDHPIYEIWNNIKDRCYCITDNAYPNYGGSGVEMCEEWLADFKIFYDWCMANGWRKGLEIDKDKLSPTKPGKLYSPEFCCFLTRKENMMYRRNTIMLYYNGVEKSLVEWCELLNLDRKAMYTRIRLGWEAKRAFETNVLEKYRHKTKNNLP